MAYWVQDVSFDFKKHFSLIFAFEKHAYSVYCTWKYEEYSWDEGENGALWSDVSNVTDDEGCEDEE